MHASMSKEKCIRSVLEPRCLFDLGISNPRGGWCLYILARVLMRLCYAQDQKLLAGPFYR